MKPQSTIDPAALQMLSSLAIELDSLEIAAGRMRARLNTLFEVLTAVPVASDDGEYAGQLAQTSDSADEAASVVAHAASTGDEAASLAASGDVAEVPDSDAAVLGLCARIEASVAEFAAAAEDEHVTLSLEDAEKAMPEAVAVVDHEPAAEAEACEVGETAADEVAVTTEAPNVSEPAGVIAQDIADAVGAPAAIDVAANGNAPVGATAAVVDDTAIASNVVAIKIKRQVWPQLMTACASVLLIAAAALVVAMPELVGFTI